MAEKSTEQLPIGQRIMRYRVRAGMSRAQLSGLIGKSPSWLYKVERGVLMPDRLSVLSELAAVLRVDISELAGAPVPTALLSPVGTVPRLIAATAVHEVVVAAPPARIQPAPEPAGVPAPPVAIEPAPPLAVVVAPPAPEEAAPPLAVVAAPPAPEAPPPPPLAVVVAPPAAEAPAPPPADSSGTPTTPATPWHTTAWERRRAIAAVVAAAAAVAAVLLYGGPTSRSEGAESPRARAAPPMTVFPAPPSDTSVPGSTAAPGSPAGSNPVAGPAPGTGPQSAAPPGSAAARAAGGTPGALRSGGAVARTSAAAPAPSGTASQSPSAWNLAAWWPSASTASSGACDGSSSGACSQGGAQSGGCSTVAYDGDTGAVPSTGAWHLTVQVGSGGMLCVHWNNAGIEGTLTGPGGRSRLVPGDTWMVLGGGPGQYTLQLRRVDPSRPNHAHLQLFG